MVAQPKTLKGIRYMQPLDYLKSYTGKSIFVKLKDGSEYSGRLRLTDNAMNLVLDDTKMLTEVNKLVAQLGTVFIRGSNLLFVSIEPEKVTFFEQDQSAQRVQPQEGAKELSEDE
ncbi:MAG: U6 snRNA-associated Sm-like protein LSm6 [Thermofilum sp.]|jgi:small nuclear ribonucleoprotein|nr:U6 snRNA-associated Sm-like protein LSm6 [Thermofilum sp.]